MTLKELREKIDKACDIYRDDEIANILVKFKVYDRDEDKVIEVDTINSMKIDIINGRDVIIGLH